MKETPLPNSKGGIAVEYGLNECNSRRLGHVNVVIDLEETALPSSCTIF
jgi:hypothetical protein